MAALLTGRESNSAVMTERPLEVGLIIPTYRERENIIPLIRAVEAALQGVAWEIVFVDDDSPDGTAEEARRIAAVDSRVRVLRRVGRKGLASACIEGMLASSAPYLAVMDGDLQHDESILPKMLALLRQGDLDMVIASRHIEGGSHGTFAKSRVLLSNFGKYLSRIVCHGNLSDPMSGFFMLDRRFLDEVVYRVSGIGFKILLDLVASSSTPVRFAEVPYTFRERERGESKLDFVVGLEYLYLLVDKLVGRFLPPQFVVYSLVGAIGVVWHLVTLEALFFGMGVGFRQSQVIATTVTMVPNFWLNNIITFRARRLKGAAFFAGMMIYLAACSIGMVTNLTLADFARNAGSPWWLAGILGLAVSSVWNYGVSSILTWRRQRTVIGHASPGARSHREQIRPS